MKTSTIRFHTVKKGGAITLDLGPNWDPAAGPIGTFSEAQVIQVKAIRKALLDLTVPVAQPLLK